MPRLVVVLPLEPLEVGARFTFRQWPLHLTVVQNFETGSSVDDIADRVRRFEARSLTVTAAHDEGFGLSGSMPVTIIEPTPELSRLHRELTAALQPLELENPQFAGDGYRPHVTIKEHSRVRAGDRLELHQLALVDLTRGGSREVLAVRRLGDSA